MLADRSFYSEFHRTFRIPILLCPFIDVTLLISFEATPRAREFVIFKGMTMFGQEKIALSVSPILLSTQPHHLRKGLYALFALVVVAQLWLASPYFSLHLRPWNHQYTANSTLEFGVIYVVSRPGSPRQQSLTSAASLTNLEIEIPEQPVWSEIDIARIRATENSSLDRGSALAWLGHRHVLRTFLHTTQETALIMEDDVDWDVRLRQDQIPLTAYAIRKFLGSHSGYYGDTADWDIIWLGHCGDYFNASRGSDLSSIKSYHDSVMPNLDNLHPWTRDFMHGIGANQNKQRLIHQSVNPLCTFAYAITRAAAKRVVDEIAISEPIRDSEHPCKAYDVRLLEGCRDHGLKCITVNPELFHHSPLSSEIAEVSIDSSTSSTEHQDFESPTNNIRCSARSRKWKEIQESIVDSTIDTSLFVKELAERSPHCYIDHV